MSFYQSLHVCLDAENNKKVRAADIQVMADQELIVDSDYLLLATY